MPAYNPGLLVLEDSTTQAKMISRMFEDQGAAVTTVTTPREFSSAPHLFDLKVNAALIDVHFGEVSGLKLIEPLSRRWPSAVLIMMTANDTDDFAVLAKAREKGAHLVLKKPFKREDVMETLADIKSIQETGARRKHIVLIDDSKTTCRIASDLLRAHGFRVSSFQSGLSAIQQLNYDHVDAVLTDMHMPEMSGSELICLVRDVWAKVPIVAMSADEKLASQKFDVDAFIQKPFGPEEIISILKNVMRREEVELDC
ncbi:MAG: response regulator [Hyphomonadaceae bacterium TMED125]|nr:MAG: response regulator [Hyphomonadaceae bacterium TMED125]